MRLYNVLRQREAEPHPPRLGGEERVEDGREILGLYAAARIRYFYDLSPLTIVLERDPDLASARHSVRGVQEDLLQSRSQPDTVGLQGFKTGDFRKTYPEPGEIQDLPGRGKRLFRHRPEAGIHVLKGDRAREPEHVLYFFLKADDIAYDGAKRFFQIGGLGRFKAEFRVAADDPDRIGDLV